MYFERNVRKPSGVVIRLPPSQALRNSRLFKSSIWGSWTWATRKDPKDCRVQLSTFVPSTSSPLSFASIKRASSTCPIPVYMYLFVVGYEHIVAVPGVCPLSAVVRVADAFSRPLKHVQYDAELWRRKAAEGSPFWTSSSNILRSKHRGNTASTDFDHRALSVSDGAWMNLNVRNLSLRNGTLERILSS